MLAGIALRLADGSWIICWRYTLLVCLLFLRSLRRSAFFQLCGCAGLFLGAGIIVLWSFFFGRIIWRVIARALQGCCCVIVALSLLLGSWNFLCGFFSSGAFQCFLR